MKHKIILLLLILILLYCLFNNTLYNVEAFSNKIYDHCFVINLNETKEGRRRWKKIKDHYYWKNKKIERFPGVYGKRTNFKKYFKENILKPEWNYGKWKYNKNSYVKLSKGELGCILSHRKIWEKIVKKNINRTLILEDDAIGVDKKIDKKLKIIMKHVPKDWDIILLGFWLHRGDFGKKVNKYIHTVKDFALLHSYIINLKGAEKLLNIKPIDKPLDTWISSISNKINIYRHNFVKPRTKYPSSSLVRQTKIYTQIKHTNNF